MATRNLLTADEIINGFPNTPPPQIDHEPIFEDIQIRFYLINANSISPPSIYGGGVHGHIGVITTPTEYAVVATMP
jgi:hypothetical protein